MSVYLHAKVLYNRLMTFVKGQIQPCQFQKGNIPWIKGRKVDPEVKQKISDSLKGYKEWRHLIGGWNKGLKGIQVGWNKGKKFPQIEGEKNGMWKGDGVGRPALHRWVDRKLGRPSRCDFCGTTKLRRYHWANKSGEYKRVLTDWLRLCVPCHKKYDLARFKDK